MADLASAGVPAPVAAPILEAYATLPPAREGGALTHGDWHLGQLVRHGGGWLLIDPDDLGAGDPAWDLARPAAWFAAGLLAPDDKAAGVPGGRLERDHRVVSGLRQVVGGRPEACEVSRRAQFRQYGRAVAPAAP
ncbi:phosphotransferase [Microbispora sp. NBC_01389]|uniref:phosphotransferase n=1 Tax=Microbispora sp. NBC_01389 TaxID=2903584 RepID=UPI00325568EF